MSKSMQKADKYFSQYIRLKHSFGSGNDLYCKCYTCGIIKPIKEIDNGHWKERENKGTRYMESNCRPQCVSCNWYKGGRPHKFEQKLIKEMGSQKVDLIRVAANQTKKISSFEYEVIAKEYRGKVKELQKWMGVKVF